MYQRHTQTHAHNPRDKPNHYCGRLEIYVAQIIDKCETKNVVDRVVDVVAGRRTAAARSVGYSELFVYDIIVLTRGRSRLAEKRPPNARSYLQVPAINDANDQWCPLT